MKKLFREYLSMLKPLPVEGIPDLILFRPIAFVLVKVLSRFPITPNQVSVAAMVTGISSGICFSRGTRECFLWAGLLYGATAVLDCGDGMLARYKKNGSPVGRIVDGTIDYINGLAIFTGLGIGMSKMALMPQFHLWIVIAVAALSMAIHSILVDYYRSQFFIHALKIRHSIHDEISVFADELSHLKRDRKKPVNRLLIRIYLFYCHIQIKYAKKQVQYDADKYYNANKIMLRLWQAIELSMHICVLILAAILYKPELFLGYTIVFANIWILLIVPFQKMANKKSI
ncbi:MAG: CDP-alcohol phosphatidyltransferase family protein [Candidatus Marinimicrobia bacterium]|nr:CDP-alcohol phosphatidyltransferase family protein [Candidatus Neomarinimicrobiota bacterium]